MPAGATRRGHALQQLFDILWENVFACKQNAGHHNFAQKVAENNSMIEHIVFYLFRMELRGTRISKLMISEQKSKTNYSELFW